MRDILKRVQDGSFANEFIEENKNGQPNLNRLRKENKSHAIEVVGNKLRTMMAWVVTPNQDKA